jgi:hypothetical protein
MFTGHDDSSTQPTISTQFDDQALPPSTSSLILALSVRHAGWLSASRPSCGTRASCLNTLTKLSTSTQRKELFARKNVADLQASAIASFASLHPSDNSLLSLSTSNGVNREASVPYQQCLTGSTSVFCTADEARSTACSAAVFGLYPNRRRRPGVGQERVHRRYAALAPFPSPGTGCGRSCESPGAK